MNKENEKWHNMGPELLGVHRLFLKFEGPHSTSQVHLLQLVFLRMTSVISAGKLSGMCCAFV
jgi:hypothetical protein